MPRRPKKPTRSSYDRDTQFRQHLDAIRLLRESPVRTEQIATALGVSTSTAEAVLGVIRRADLGLTTETRGKERWHSLPADALAGVLLRAARSGRTTP